MLDGWWDAGWWSALLEQVHAGVSGRLSWRGPGGALRRREVLLAGTGASAELRRAFIASWIYSSGADEWLGSTAQCSDGRACVVPHAGQELHLSNVGLGEPSHFGLSASAVSDLEAELTAASARGSAPPRLLLLVDVGRFGAAAQLDLLMLGWAALRAPAFASLPETVVAHLASLLGPGELRDEEALLRDVLRTLARIDRATAPVYIVLCYRGRCAPLAGRAPSASPPGLAGRESSSGSSCRQSVPGVGLASGRVSERISRRESTEAEPGEWTPELAARLLNATRRRLEAVAEAECDAIVDRGAAAAIRAGGGTLVATAAPRVRMLTYAPELIRRAGRRTLDALFTMLTLQLLA
jgi:hypothetical protein